MYTTAKELEAQVKLAQKLLTPESADFALKRVYFNTGAILEALDGILYHPQRFNLCKQVDQAEERLEAVQRTFDDNSDEVAIEKEAKKLVVAFTEDHHKTWTEINKFYTKTFGETWVPYRNRKVTPAASKASARFAA